MKTLPPFHFAASGLQVFFASQDSLRARRRFLGQAGAINAPLNFTTRLGVGA